MEKSPRELRPRFNFDCLLRYVRLSILNRCGVFRSRSSPARRTSAPTTSWHRSASAPMSTSLGRPPRSRHGRARAGQDDLSPRYRRCTRSTVKNDEVVVEYGERFASPFIAAQRGYVDDVIGASQTRAVARAPAMLANKARRAPAPQTRKHSAVAVR